MKYYGIRKREKQRAIALKDAETEGLPSPNAIGTLQTNGKVTSLQKVLKLDTNVVRRPIYFYKKMWYYIYGD